jgi:hypothetical protein
MKPFVIQFSPPSQQFLLDLYAFLRTLFSEIPYLCSYSSMRSQGPHLCKTTDLYANPYV